MNILLAENIKMSYGDKDLLNDVTLNIEEDDKIGIVGVNGTGKSTLLKIISGSVIADQGNITKKRDLKISYLSQKDDLSDQNNVLEEIFSAENELSMTLKEYFFILEELEKDPNNNDLVNNLIKFNEKIERLGAWQYESLCKTVLSKMGINDYHDIIGHLSGGQRKRVALAKALINSGDLLVLDEPTNHLDYFTIEWLEEFLKSWNKAMVMITHDRYFLDRVCNKICEIADGGLYTYNGNYEYYLEQKEERNRRIDVKYQKDMNFLKKEIQWVRAGVQARGTKQKYRLQNFEEVKNNLKKNSSSSVEIDIKPQRLGKKIIEIENISKSFDKKEIVDDFSYTFKKGDRIGILGENGSGKTTLLNMITGTLSPDNGNVIVGDTVKIGYLGQIHEHEDEEVTIIDYIKNIKEFIELASGKTITASQILEKFLFPIKKQRQLVKSLSGGELKRLHLLKVLIESPNILVLDEPTNDLDIETLNVLEDFLDGYEGVILIVTHDRYFMDRVVDSLMVFEGNGSVTVQTGNYTEYFLKKKEEKTETAAVKKEIVKEKSKNNNKMSYKDKFRLEQLEKEIPELENQLDEINKEMNDNPTNYSYLAELSEKKEMIEMEILEKMEEMELLEELK
jgi:ATP-binding cassette subfamily F protein uup